MTEATRTSEPSELGNRYGRLVVVERAEDGKNWLRRWVCQCDCGNQKTILQSSLRHGLTQSCGCLHKERTSITSRICNTVHGGSKGGTASPEYMAWDSMRQRCMNPRHANFANYGGRGIGVCDRWSDFAAFLADMGDRPGPDFSIDRIDNESGYSPENCRWATRTQQTRNTRQNVHLTVRGERRLLVEFADEYGIQAGVVRGRVRRGWSHEEALCGKKGQ